MTAICTVVVRPTKTGSVPRGASDGGSGRPLRVVSASYQGPQEPSAFLARTRADVPVRSSDGQRDHRERGVLVDLADRLAATEVGQRLLDELRASAARGPGRHRTGRRRSPTAA